MAIPSPQKLLRTYNLSPKNSFGQNFLGDANLTHKIAEAAAPDPGTTVLELGAGLGALTDQLLRQGARVVAVERDRELVPILREIFSEAVESGHLSVLEADAKSLDWGAAIGAAVRAGQRATETSARRWVVCGNLPYQITGPLIEKAVQLAPEIERAVFLVQKEVADRLAATPGTKTYGALSVFTQAQFRVRRAFSIRPGAFVPPPKVDSAVIVMEPWATPITEETGDFRQVVKLAFAARRKTLKNAWKGLLPADELERVARACGIELSLRGETLTVEQFAAMARFLRTRKDQDA